MTRPGDIEGRLRDPSRDDFAIDRKNYSPSLSTADMLQPSPRLVRGIHGTGFNIRETGMKLPINSVGKQRWCTLGLALLATGLTHVGFAQETGTFTRELQGYSAAAR